jgi:hypothetical protein
MLSERAKTTSNFRMEVSFSWWATWAPLHSKSNAMSVPPRSGRRLGIKGWRHAAPIAERVRPETAMPEVSGIAVIVVFSAKGAGSNECRLVFRNKDGLGIESAFDCSPLNRKTLPFVIIAFLMPGCR